MNAQDLFKLVNITDKGAICLGESIVCDGFAPGFQAAAFTHIPSNYIANGFETCMHQYCVYASEITVDLLEAIADDSYARQTQLHRLTNGRSQMISHNSKCDYLTMYDSKHMLGASQILLTTDKFKIFYSGDIAHNDSPQECDVLVLDSTHGSPIFGKKIDQPSLDRRFIETIVTSLEEEKPVCIHAPGGHLQEIIHNLTLCSDIPHDTIQFLCSAKDKRIAQIYSKYMKIRECIDTECYDAENVIHGDYPWIEFTTNLERTMREESGKVFSIHVSGGFGNSTMRQNENGCRFASNGPTEFTEILNYVEKANPKVVVIDNSKSGCGSQLVDQINNILKIPAKSLPVVINA